MRVYKMGNISKKSTAMLMLLCLSVQTFYPGTAYALTSGPVQPEMQDFSPAGVNDMVNLFTGDFKQDIPLLDVGGYPVNLSYASGTGMEDEATWVGMGWILNPGTVTRTLRGLPDDFDAGRAKGANGKKGDQIQKHYEKKDFIKYGAELTFKTTALAWEGGKASMKMDIYKDNYYGIGASFGAGAGFGLGRIAQTPLTVGLNCNLNSDVRSGVSISPSLKLTMDNDDGRETNSLSISGGFTYNTRAGLKSIDLAASYSTQNDFARWCISAFGNNIDKTYGSELLANSFSSSATHYFGQSHSPSFSNDISNEQFSLALDGGVTIFGGYVGLGGAGYYATERVQDKDISVPAYGYMNYLNGRKNINALLDFNREKDGVFIESTPAIGIPVATHDFFNATAQTGTQQFRPYFNGNYTVYDRAHYNTTVQLGAGITLGGGNLFKGGARIDGLVGGSESKKWADNNGFIHNSEEGNFSTDAPYFAQEAVTLKQVGEHCRMDKNYYDLLLGNKTVMPAVNTGGFIDHANAYSSFVTREDATPIPIGTVDGQPYNIKKAATVRTKRNFGFSYLTAEMAKHHALDKEIKYIGGGASALIAREFVPEARQIDGFRERNHISEITVTGNDGKRMVYGIPVYSISQEEVSFSAASPSTASDKEIRRRSGLIPYSVDANSNPVHSYGREEILSKETTPSYPTSFLLTAILSPDYVDKTGDGITDDDLGTAIKFNYRKFASKSNPYVWRAPYGYLQANYNEGYLSDPKDDKASYTWGKKETWYLESIETKTMIAIFTTSDRQDGLGVMDSKGAKNTFNFRLQKLDKISLYSKADIVYSRSQLPSEQQYNYQLALSKVKPIKEAHFEYDYSLYPEVPNNSQAIVDNPEFPGDNTKQLNLAHGKLTLKKVYFTFGKNNRGKSNPYEFEYDLRPINNGSIIPPPTLDPDDPNYNPNDPYNKEANDQYTERQADRWGTYKQSWYNHFVSKIGGGLTSDLINNSEFPFSLQKNAVPDGMTDNEWKGMIDRFASKWQLNKIKTPTGGIISVEYESDDYAFVQNRKAMQMCPLQGIGNANTANTKIVAGLKSNYTLYVNLPLPYIPSAAANTEIKRNQELWNTYIGKDENKIYYKVLADIDNKGHYEFINGYAVIQSISIDPANSRLAIITLASLDGNNPICKAAWQLLRTDLPQYAYDNYDNSDASSDFWAAITSLIQAVFNVGEFFKPFDKRAYNSDFANRVDLSKSMVRLCTPDGRKTGGGARVKKITISDEWSSVSGNSSNPTSSYGQVYNYETKDADGKTISSGVASYEPQIGNEENPFHEPENFTEKVHWSADKYHYIEKPYCESYFPAAGVGYSKVTVTSIGSNGQGETGYIENEFYTAKDFPTIVDKLPPNKVNYENSLLLQLFTCTSINRLAVSQGFRIELNDMHGKQRSVKVFNNSGTLISSSESFYGVKDDNAELKELDNDVDVLQTGTNGQVVNSIERATLATDVDFVTDARESSSSSYGAGLGIYAGGMILPFFVPLFIPYTAVNANVNLSFDNYNGISTVKVINRFGILKKIRTMQNGSYITAENLLWDGETGEVLLSRTQNEFNDYTYAFSYPAYLAYDGMGPMSKNIGATFSNFSTGTDGIINSSFTNFLAPGDVLMNTNPDAPEQVQEGWVMKAGDGTLRFIDRDGNFISTLGTYSVLRSGRRNLLSASAGSLILMNDPRVDGHLDLGVDKKVLDSKAAFYGEEWGIPVNNIYDEIASPGCNFNVSSNCFEKFFFSAISKVLQNNSSEFRRGIFAKQSDNGNQSYTAASFMSAFPSYPDYTYDNCVDNFIDNLAASSFKYYLLSPHIVAGSNPQQYYLMPGDIAQLGVLLGHSYQIVFDEVDNSFNDLCNSNSGEQDMISSLFFDRFPTNSNYLKYCLINNGNCSYTLRRTDHCPGERPVLTKKSNRQQTNKARGSTPTLLVTCNPSPSCYTNMVTFHIQKDGGPVFDCLDPVGKTINPYYTGVLGNWRTKTGYVYSADRVQKPGITNQDGGTDIRRSGYYANYVPFWSFPSSGSLAAAVNPAVSYPTTDPLSRWVWNSQSVYFDRSGNEVENVSPMDKYSGTEEGAKNRYGAALFGYNETMATAVAANARHNEIAFDGFEDYDFMFGSPGAVTEQCPLQKHFDWGFARDGGVWKCNGGEISPQTAHTGRFSLKLKGTTEGSQGTITITKPLGNAVHSASPILSYDGNNHYVLNANEQAAGFAPVQSKKYILSLWVNEDALTAPTAASNKIQHLAISINGTPLTISSLSVPVVEKWKRLEIPVSFNNPAGFTLELSGTNVYVDDIRLFPADAQMASYVYDYRTLRLMAQLDENNFATFYEYDDEGTPVRVKKETDRGIMTLKENRQNAAKH